MEKLHDVMQKHEKMLYRQRTSVVVSAIIECAAGYIPGSLIPTSLVALKQLALKTGRKAIAKWISTLSC